MDDLFSETVLLLDRPIHPSPPGSDDEMDGVESADLSQWRMIELRADLEMKRAEDEDRDEPVYVFDIDEPKDGILRLGVDNMRVYGKRHTLPKSIGLYYLHMNDANENINECEDEAQSSKVLPVAKCLTSFTQKIVFDGTRDYDW